MNANHELATKLFSSGFNCAQSVIAVFCEKYGMDKETALKIAGGLGGGFRSADICGAVSGAVLVVGLKYGQSIDGDTDTKQNCSAKTIEFLNEFRARNKAITCRDILQCDITTPEGMAEARSKNLFRTTCVDAVKSAVSILEESGY